MATGPEAMISPILPTTISSQAMIQNSNGTLAKMCFGGKNTRMTRMIILARRDTNEEVYCCEVDGKYNNWIHISDTRMTLLRNCLAKQAVGNRPTWEPPIWIRRAPGLGSRLAAAHSGKEEIQLPGVQLFLGCMQTSLTGNLTMGDTAKTALSFG